MAIGFVGEGSNSQSLLGLEWTLTAIFATEFVTRFVASYDRPAYPRGHND